MKQIVLNIAIDVWTRALEILTGTGARGLRKDKGFLKCFTLTSLVPLTVQSGKGIRERRRLSSSARLTGLFGVILLNFASLSTGWAQAATTQQVLTLEVLELNKININNNAVTLIIDRANLQEGAPMPATNADGTLFWMTNGENKKITVASDNAAPRFKLRIVAEELAQGTGSAVPEVVLNDNKTHDLVIGVTRNSGKCRIRYTAFADVRDGIGRESYTITYTITGS